MTTKQKLYLVNASPLEKERYKVTPAALSNWCQTAKRVVEDIDPALFFNMDESSDLPRSSARLKKVFLST